MAPLYSPCFQYSKSYSPLSLRKVGHLPGAQARSVPFTRPTKAISTRFQVRAVSEQVVQSDQADMPTNGSHSSSVLEDGMNPGTMAVHGGERAGRPRVSGEAAVSPISSSECTACCSCSQGRRAGRASSLLCSGAGEAAGASRALNQLATHTICCQGQLWEGGARVD